MEYTVLCMYEHHKSIKIGGGGVGAQNLYCNINFATYEHSTL